MKLRTLFVTDRKQIHVPEGWKIDTVSITTPPRGKPQYCVLLKKEDEIPKKKIGFGVKLKK